MSTPKRQRTYTPNSCFERVDKRFDSFHNQIYKGAKGKGILTNMPTYFNKGAEQVKVACTGIYVEGYVHMLR